MKLSDQDAVQIFGAIILQALDDYQSLRKKNKTSVSSKDCGSYGLKEIEDFFLGDWGEAIIQDGLRYRMLDGSDFLRAASI